MNIGGTNMESKTDIKLTSAEIGALWTTYMNKSLTACVLKYFIVKVKDKDIKSDLEFAISTAQNHLKSISEIFNIEDYPIPHGFTDEDVNLNAPPLFDDNYYLFYLRSIAMLDLSAYGIALPLMARQDMIDFLRSILKAEDIPASTAWDTFVTDSKESPFSDKLMLSHLNTIIVSGLANYAIASTVSMRHDILTDYVRLIAEVGQYGMDVLNRMIDNGWLEQPPKAVIHYALANA